ncbi:hypothetical protein [Campylobacter gastrosuis]|uniref:Uncharacterized protein n=1 Tax=Campylobacter gastrosuis TaxID=2974576 RepID=A0ABT7HN57_9BACT|nr:hypothetical protein [Campylobacter gastrosuis]MDL0088333.1 hypothetical protein [Campylobacter gastrosuis]
MSKILAVFALFTSLFSAVPNYEPSFTFELFKDEWARVIITEKATLKRDSFDFRWTLFDSTNIIVQSFFRRYPRHFTMSLRHGQNRYKQGIIPDFNMPPNDIVKLYLTFVGFKNKMASFRVDILDESKRIDVEFLEPKRKR